MAGPDDSLLDGVFDQPDDHLAADSAASRSRRRWLRQQAREAATLAGVLLARAERGDAVSVEAGPWTHCGRLITVTAGLCVLARPDGALVLLPTEAVAAVDGPDEVVDDRAAAGGPDLAGVLATLVAERPAVELLLAEGASRAGVLVGVGKEAATVVGDASVASVRLTAIVGCVLHDRGSEVSPRVLLGR